MCTVLHYLFPISVQCDKKNNYLMHVKYRKSVHWRDYCTFHPLSTIVIHTLNFAQVKSMDDNCGVGGMYGCGEQVGVASGCGWNLWAWLLGVVARRYIYFLILLIPTPLVSVLFCSSIPTFCSFLKMFFVLYVIIIIRLHIIIIII